MNDVIDIKTYVLIEPSILGAMPLYQFYHMPTEINMKKHLVSIEEAANFDSNKIINIIRDRRLHLVLGAFGMGIEGAITLTINQKRMLHLIGDIKDLLSNLIGIMEQFLHDSNGAYTTWIEDTSKAITISASQKKDCLQLSIDEYKRYLDFDASQFDHDLLPLNGDANRFIVEIDRNLFYLTIFEEAEKLFSFLNGFKGEDESFQLDRINELKLMLTK